METREDNRLEDLVAEIMSRGQLANPELLTSVRLSVARMETKLDDALANMKDFLIFQAEVRKHMVVSDARLSKLEWRWNLVLIVLGGMWAALLVLLGAVAYPVAAKAIGALFG